MLFFTFANLNAFYLRPVKRVLVAILRDARPAAALLRMRAFVVDRPIATRLSQHRTPLNPHPEEPARSAGVSKDGPELTARPEPLLDNNNNLLHNDRTPAHQGDVSSRRPETEQGAVPAGPARNRAPGRPWGSARTTIRRSCGSFAEGLWWMPVSSEVSEAPLGRNRRVERREAGRVLHRTRVRVESADDVLTLLAGLGAPIPLGKRKRGQWVARNPFSPGGAALAARAI